MLSITPNEAECDAPMPKGGRRGQPSVAAKTSQVICHIAIMQPGRRASTGRRSGDQQTLTMVLRATHAHGRPVDEAIQALR